MDGTIIAAIAGGGTIISTLIIGFVKINRSIGRVEGKVDSFNGRFSSLEERVADQGKRINHIIRDYRDKK